MRVRISLNPNGATKSARPEPRERAGAREAKDWARADAIRDQIKAAGIEIEDTTTGPKWSVEGQSV